MIKFRLKRIWARITRPFNQIRYASTLRWVIFDCECQCECGDFATPQEAAAWIDIYGGGSYFIWPSIRGLEMVASTPNPDWSITLKPRLKPSE